MHKIRDVRSRRQVPPDNAWADDTHRGLFFGGKGVDVHHQPHYLNQVP